MEGRNIDVHFVTLRKNSFFHKVVRGKKNPSVEKIFSLEVFLTVITSKVKLFLSFCVH